ncbi:unnamed protein product [Leuciscus chuanchicus]
MDRHLMGHMELTAAARRETMLALKRKKVLGDLAELRATNLTEEEVSEEEVQACGNPGCLKVRDEVADLNRQVDTLSQALRDVTRRYRLLRRKSRPNPSAQVARVTSRLLSALRSPEKGDAQYFYFYIKAQLMQEP